MFLGGKLYIKSVNNEEIFIFNEKKERFWGCRVY